MLVNTEKSAFNLAKGTGVPIFTDATSGRVIEAPVKDVTTATTTVSVQSGQTIILGGMITNSNNVVHRKVPFLGDIPLLGRLFRYDLNRYEKRELLVFLTPIVLDSEAVSYELMNDDLARSRTMKIAAEELDRWQQYRETFLNAHGSANLGEPVVPMGVVHLIAHRKLHWRCLDRHRWKSLLQVQLLIQFLANPSRQQSLV